MSTLSDLNCDVHLHAEIEILKQSLVEKQSQLIAMETTCMRESDRQVELEDSIIAWQDKYDRLYESHKRVQKVNQNLEDKLLKLVDRNSGERAQLTSDVATLSVRLAQANYNINTLQREIERYKTDMSLAIQLLQCKPDSFISQKVSSLPLEMQSKMSQYMRLETNSHSDSEGSTSGVGVATAANYRVLPASDSPPPMCPFPPTAMVYSMRGLDEELPTSDGLSSTNPTSSGNGVITNGILSATASAGTTANNNNNGTNNGNNNNNNNNNNSSEKMISPSMMARYLQDELKASEIKHCDTCLCANRDLTVLADTAQSYTVGTQTQLQGDANNSLCLRCNSNLNSPSRTNSPYIMKLIKSSDSIISETKSSSMSDSNLNMMLDSDRLLYTPAKKDDLMVNPILGHHRLCDRTSMQQKLTTTTIASNAAITHQEQLAAAAANAKYVDIQIENEIRKLNIKKSSVSPQQQKSGVGGGGGGGGTGGTYQLHQQQQQQQAQQEVININSNCNNSNNSNNNNQNNSNNMVNSSNNLKKYDSSRNSDVGGGVASVSIDHTHQQHHHQTQHQQHSHQHQHQQQTHQQQSHRSQKCLSNNDGTSGSTNSLWSKTSSSNNNNNNNSQADGAKIFETFNRNLIKSIKTDNPKVAGPRLCALRIQNGSTNILLDNIESSDVTPILYTRRSRFLDEELDETKDIITSTGSSNGGGGASASGISGNNQNPLDSSVSSMSLSAGLAPVVTTGRLGIMGAGGVGGGGGGGGDGGSLTSIAIGDNKTDFEKYREGSLFDQQSIGDGAVGGGDVDCGINHLVSNLNKTQIRKDILSGSSMSISDQSPVMASTGGTGGLLPIGGAGGGGVGAGGGGGGILSVTNRIDNIEMDTTPSSRNANKSCTQSSSISSDPDIQESAMLRRQQLTRVAEWVQNNHLDNIIDPISSQSTNSSVDAISIDSGYKTKINNLNNNNNNNNNQHFNSTMTTNTTNTSTSTITTSAAAASAAVTDNLPIGYAVHHPQQQLQQPHNTFQSSLSDDNKLIAGISNETGNLFAQNINNNFIQLDNITKTGKFAENSYGNGGCVSVGGIDGVAGGGGGGGGDDNRGGDINASENQTKDQQIDFAQMEYNVKQFLLKQNEWSSTVSNHHHHHHLQHQQHSQQPHQNKRYDNDKFTTLIVPNSSPIGDGGGGGGGNVTTTTITTATINSNTSGQTSKINNNNIHKNPHRTETNL